MLDLSTVDDTVVSSYLTECYSSAPTGSDRWRIIGAVLTLSEFHSFSGTRTYPRPDHPDPRKRLPIEYLLAAVLISLRTTLENEQKAVQRLVSRYPNIESLRSATVDGIAECIRVAGMPMQKAKRIRECLDQIAELNNGLASLSNWPLPKARAYLLSLPGIGPKAADCVLTIGLGHASMVVDVNVFRMSVAIFNLTWATPTSFAQGSQVAEVKERLDFAVGDDVFLCQIVHTLLLLEGRRARTHEPDRCRIAKYCATCAENTSNLLFV